jgi:hypothetical protein
MSPHLLNGCNNYTEIDLMLLSTSSTHFLRHLIHVVKSAVNYHIELRLTSLANDTEMLVVDLKVSVAKRFHQRRK